MRVTFVIGTADMSGGTRVVAAYADGLKKRGHDVTVVSIPRRRLTLRDRLRSLKNGEGWPQQPPRLWKSHLDGLDVDYRVIDRQRAVTAADVPDADAVIATWWETAEWVNALPPQKGAKAYLIQHHEVIFDGQPRDRVEATWRMPLHKIVISRWLLDLAREEYGDDTASLVPNSVDTRQFNSPPRGRQQRPVVGTLYNTNSRFKGCEVSLDAVGRAMEKFPDLQLASFGNEPVRDFLPLPPGSRYTESPAQERIKELYAQCDVWLCGSHSEGFGLTTLEAMACRCPAVSTRVGGSTDLIQDGVNGYVVDIGDAAALADRVCRILELSETQWLAMSDAALETATRYSWGDATTLFEKALQVAIERDGRAGSHSAQARVIRDRQARTRSLTNV